MTRRFSDLRHRAKPGDTNLTEKARKALAEVYHLPYGEAIADWLASVVQDITPPDDEGAWREREARRRFADEILNMMESAQNEPDGNRSRD